MAAIGQFGNGLASSSQANSEKSEMQNETSSDHASSKASSLDQFFGEQTRRELIEEDREAWKYVCGLLFSIVFGGVLLGVFGTMLATTMMH
jgi:hypothetical protein